MLLPLLFTFVSIALSQDIAKRATLTPLTAISDGAQLFVNTNEVQSTYNGWEVRVTSYFMWQFMISLDNTFGFNPTMRSSITITINATPITANELLFGFATHNTDYVAMAIPFDHSGRSNAIYPSCIPSLRTTQSFGVGDIAIIPNTNRKCDIAGGDCNNWRNMIPANRAFNAEMPITFTLEHYPATNLMEIYVEDSSSRGLHQRCSFGSGFVANNGLKIYISGATPYETYTVSSFNIFSIIYYPSEAPTPSPTPSPTPLPTPSPTGDPISLPSTGVPSATPTEFTQTPTSNPTQHPTQRPTPRPTRGPSPAPTEISRSPTSTPTQRPTAISLSPTSTPTATPTMITAVPTNPTAFPSLSPILSPTRKPTPAGFVFGAFDQLCAESAVSTGYCRDITDIYYDNNINCVAPYSCCMCSAIECGFRGTPCGTVTMGLSAALGVKNIRIAGDVVGSTGATIHCQGTASCAASNIIANDIMLLHCDGQRSCADAIIIISDPKPNFALECSGIESCHGLQIVIDLSPCIGLGNIFNINKIICKVGASCERLQIIIHNTGCDKVLINYFECSQPNACDGAIFNLIGDVEIENCNCGESCNTAIGLDQCFLGQEMINCQSSQSCALQSQTITNPQNGFQLLCSAINSCFQSTFIIEMTPAIAKPMTSIAKFLFGGENAARGAIFIIDNRQGILMTLELIECGGKNSCADTTFVLGADVTVRNIICAPNACTGCSIQRTPDAPVLPCDPTQIGLL